MLHLENLALRQQLAALDRKRARPSLRLTDRIFSVVIIARRQSGATGTLDAALMLPYVVPGMVLGIGFIVSFNKPPLSMVGTALIIILVIFIRRLPYAVRSSAAILKQININVEKAAVNLGATPGRASSR